MASGKCMSGFLGILVNGILMNVHILCQMWGYSGISVMHMFGTLLMLAGCMMLHVGWRPCRPKAC